MRLYDGKIVRVKSGEYLILRTLQPKRLSYHYEIYRWDSKKKERSSRKSLLTIAKNLNIKLPRNPTTDQAGNTIWENI